MSSSSQSESSKQKQEILDAFLIETGYKRVFRLTSFIHSSLNITHTQTFKKGNIRTETTRNLVKYHCQSKKKIKRITNKGNKEHGPQMS